jgi:hypothetical protein
MTGGAPKWMKSLSHRGQSLVTGCVCGLKSSGDRTASKQATGHPLVKNLHMSAVDTQKISTITEGRKKVYDHEVQA